MLFQKKAKVKQFNNNSKYEYLIVGLGNPGLKYDMTRHNAGFITIDSLANENNVDVNKLKYNALICDVEISGKKCMLVKPQTFMNNSGEAVGEIAKFFKIPAEKVLVISDDISLDVGKIRIKRKGSAGGHNGLKSIIAHLGCDTFPRIKVGVGKKPSADYDLADWVLGKFPKELMSDLQTAVKNSVSSISLIVNGEIDKAMNLYNS